MNGPTQRAAVAERKSATARLSNATKVVEGCERRLGLDERWTTEHAEYTSTLEYLSRREFVRAVEELQGLLMQRLFELSKANLADTGMCCGAFHNAGLSCIPGYKLRKHISAHITKRSEAVRKSLERYNRIAAKQRPKQPQLEYGEIANWIWLGDFELLKTWDSSLLDRPWTSPVNREAAGKWWKVRRAKEELVRSQVEAWRLWSWVQDEDSALEAKVDALHASRPLMASYTAEFAARRKLSNDRIRFYLRKLFDNPHYQGKKPSVEALTAVASHAPATDPAELGDRDAEDDSLLRASDLFANLTL